MLFSEDTPSEVQHLAFAGIYLLPYKREYSANAQDHSAFTCPRNGAFHQLICGHKVVEFEHERFPCYHGSNCQTVANPKLCDNTIIDPETAGLPFACPECLAYARRVHDRMNRPDEDVFGHKVVGRTCRLVSGRQDFTIKPPGAPGYPEPSSSIKVRMPRRGSDVSMQSALSDDEELKAVKRADEEKFGKEGAKLAARIEHAQGKSKTARTSFHDHQRRKFVAKKVRKAQRKAYFMKALEEKRYEVEK
ncbi:hypothetical protein MBLNU457_2044t1 [Dothideomycetes sp. NU457]